MVTVILVYIVEPCQSQFCSLNPTESHLCSCRGMPMLWLCLRRKQEPLYTPPFGHQVRPSLLLTYGTTGFHGVIGDLVHPTLLSLFGSELLTLVTDQERGAIHAYVHHNTSLARVLGQNWRCSDDILITFFLRSWAYSYTVAKQVFGPIKVAR